MTPDAVDETNIGAVFALWVDRIEDLNRAIAEHRGRRAPCAVSLTPVGGVLIMPTWRNERHGMRDRGSIPPRRPTDTVRVSVGSITTRKGADVTAMTHEVACKIRDFTNMALKEGDRGEASLISLGAGYYSVGVPPVPGGHPCPGLAALKGGGDRPMRCAYHAMRETWNNADRGPAPCTTASVLVVDPTFRCRLAPSAIDAIGSSVCPWCRRRDRTQSGERFLHG